MGAYLVFGNVISFNMPLIHPVIGKDIPASTVRVPTFWFLTNAMICIQVDSGNTMVIVRECAPWFWTLSPMLLQVNCSNVCVPRLCGAKFFFTSGAFVLHPKVLIHVYSEVPLVECRISATWLLTREFDWTFTFAFPQ